MAITYIKLTNTPQDNHHAIVRDYIINSLYQQLQLDIEHNIIITIVIYKDGSYNYEADRVSLGQSLKNHACEKNITTFIFYFLTTFCATES